MQSNYQNQNSITAGPPNPFASLRHASGELTVRMMVWLLRYQQRQELREILGNDARFFSDIGVSRETIHRESGKWFWQA